MPAREKTKLKARARDAILLRHITTGKIGCGPHKSKKDFSRPRVRRETARLIDGN
jgi:hypothetical protein